MHICLSDVVHNPAESKHAPIPDCEDIVQCLHADLSLDLKQL